MAEVKCEYCQNIIVDCIVRCSECSEIVLCLQASGGQSGAYCFDCLKCGSYRRVSRHVKVTLKCTTTFSSYVMFVSVVSFIHSFTRVIGTLAPSRLPPSPSYLPPWVPSLRILHHPLWYAWIPGSSGPEKFSRMLIDARSLYSICEVAHLIKWELS